MPLASVYSLHWYGPGLGAAVDVCTPTAEATIKGSGRLDAKSTTAPSAYARINDGRQLRAVNTTAPTAYARVSAKGRMAAVGVIGVITQDDVTGAVWQAQVEPGKTFQAAILELLAGGGSGGPSAASIADAILARNLAGGADGGRTVRDALRAGRNRVTVDKDTGTITVYAEDDTTVAWTATATFVKRDAVASVDPA